MRLIRLERTPKPSHAFVLDVWKKRVYIEGWYVHVQIGKRAWTLAPKVKPPPAWQTKDWPHEV